MKSYLNNLKAAVINEDIKRLEEILNEEPSFKSLDEAKEIEFYFQEALRLIQEKKDKLFKDMQKIKKIKNYTS